MKIVIVNSNPIHNKIERELVDKYEYIKVIHTRHELTEDKLTAYQPDYLFFLHWSWIIPREIYEKYTCIVFHMTDLPFGRGGSPLQNLIVRGISETKLSAIRVEEGIDTGAIYVKKPLALLGTAEEIFLRAGKLMVSMIEEITTIDLQPVPQTGEPTFFKRRTPEESNITMVSELEKLYDYIRMLDADGYPKAYIETEYFKFEFSRASIKANEVIADVRIIKK